MKTGPIGLAAKAKGTRNLLKRARAITQRYGTTPAKMEQALSFFAQTLDRFNCGATFPLTAVTLERNSKWIGPYASRNIEFAVHGYTHLDYSLISPGQTLAHLERARDLFAKAGITATGFRSPYLRLTPALYTALERAGFSYASNQPIMWAVLDDKDLTPSTLTGYERALKFYEPWSEEKYPSVPRLRDGIVEIPVSLPDDEILVDRLGAEGADGLLARAWRRILLRTHELGELFTLQLHPERAALCAGALSTVLEEANRLTPTVWLARLDEVASWWQNRTNATADVACVGSGTWQLSVDGPPGTTVLARNVEVLGPAEVWSGDYRKLRSATCTVRADRQPILGISPACPAALGSFLSQQGFLYQVSHEHHSYAYSVDRADFGPEDERPLLNEIERSDAPLVRLGRWPDGARSTLCVTGDIDAMTIWDYGLRLFGA